MRNSFLKLCSPQVNFLLLLYSLQVGLILLSHSLPFHLAHISFNFFPQNFSPSFWKIFSLVFPCFSPTSEQLAPLQPHPAMLLLDPNSSFSCCISAWIPVIHELYGCNFILLFLTSFCFCEAHE